MGSPKKQGADQPKSTEVSVDESFELVEEDLESGLIHVLGGFDGRWVHQDGAGVTKDGRACSARRGCSGVAGVRRPRTPILAPQSPCTSPWVKSAPDGMPVA